MRNVLAAIICVFGVSAGYAQVNVLTQHNNLKRTGWNDNETILTQANVSGGNFGLVARKKVDDQVYAQPLVVSNVKIDGTVHKNVLYVATVNNSIYAFDADDASTTPLWQVNLTFKGYRAPLNTDMTDACGGNYKDFSGKMGTVCTPVVDIATSTMYLLVRSASTNGKNFVQYLHAINIKTGKEVAGSPVRIKAQIAGSGDGSVGGVIPFDDQHEGPRAALLLYNNTVYMAWASHCDWSPYHGWILGYDATTLKQKYVFNDTRNGGLAGIWMSGNGPAVDDDGFIYVSTGNGSVGSFGNPNDTTNRGESLLKLKPGNGTLKVVDFFTPNDFQYLEDNDLDYGVDGVMLIPNTNLSLSGSKESYLYLMNNNAMGGVTSDNSNAVQMLDVNASADFYSKHLHGSPVYFKNSTGQEYVYAWAEGGFLKQFPFNRSAGKFDTANKKVGYATLPYGMPGSMLSVSSKGSTDGTGILWASHPLQGDANQAIVPGIVQAFSADDVTHELWNSGFNSKRDGVGNFAKFVCPTIANGRVYVASFSNYINVYGLNPPKAACANTLPAKWQSSDIGYLAFAGSACYNNGVYTVKSSGDDIWGTQDGFHFVYQSFNPTSGDIVARIVSMDNTDAWAKCGVMFRKNLDPGSPHVFMSLTRDNGLAFQNRLLQGSDSYNKNTGGVQAPYWVKVSKRGDKYIGYMSLDNANWVALDSVNISLGDYTYAGIAYTTHNNGVQGTAVVDNVLLSSNDVVAIELGALRGRNVNNSYAALQWASAHEPRSDVFDIERSDDNLHFSLLGTIPASVAGGGVHKYSFNDEHPLPGINYYRVKQVSGDGDIKYSNILPLSFNTYTFNIYPNPVHNQLFVRYGDDLGTGKTVNVQLINTAGQVVYQHNITVQGLANTTVLNLPPSLAAGMYIVQAVNEKGERRTRNVFVER